jgi:hypothetical protein
MLPNPDLSRRHFLERAVITMSLPLSSHGLLRSLAHSSPGGTNSLPDEGPLASFAGATGWLNSEPLTPEGLHGRVILVDFWTYTCVNWLRTLPYVRAWADKYAGAGLTGPPSTPMPV